MSQSPNNPSNPASAANAAASATPAANQPLPSGQAVAVPAPVAGQNVAVNSSPAGDLQLQFDPANASFSRSGNSLVFETPGGGSVTVTDFFVVGDQSLPTLTLPDGTKVAAADLLTGLDMTTAAGPAAGAAPTSGGTNYSGEQESKKYLRVSWMTRATRVSRVSWVTRALPLHSLPECVLKAFRFPRMLKLPSSQLR